MLWILLIVAVLIAYFAINNCDRIYVGAYLCGIISIIIMLFVLIMCLNFFSTSGKCIEKLAYTLVGHVGLFDLKNIVNFSVMLFILSITFFNLKNDVFFGERMRKIIYVALFVVSSLCCFLFNSAQMCEKIYIISSEEVQKVSGSFFQIAISLLNNAVIILPCILTFINVILNIKHTRLIFRRKQFCAAFFPELFIILNVFLLLYITPVKFFFNNFDLYDFEYLYYSIKNYGQYLTYINILVVSVLVSLVVSIKNGLLEKKDRNSKKRIALEFEEIRHIFHTYKNAMFSIKVMTDMAVSKDNLEDVKEMLKKIKKCAVNYGQYAGSFLDIDKGPRIMNEVFSLTDCIVQAETMSAIPCSVKFIKNIKTEDDIIKGNFKEMTNVFLNLIGNAVDAITKKGNEDGEINIEVWNEKNYVCAVVSDNGIGINRKLLKKIFIPLYTTKQTNQNWGLGLSHVKSIVERHMGYVYVISKEMNYTKIQLFLPLADS